MPVVLIGIALFFAFKPGLSDEALIRRTGQGAISLTVVLPIGAYDGLFGPGTGSFFMMAFVMLAGFGDLKAAAHTKMLNFASNAGALAVFATTGATWWVVVTSTGMTLRLLWPAFG